ncbi:MAG: toll/interleukin-1 receptor domain-containing protein [Hyphomonadaceae bacterium]|nr:toll/interleukin-1 receptor domain-containing protein [Hyphomonadaceae bacterium]
MVDVFISYKQEERERMRPLADVLRLLKVEVWFDERLSPDRPFTEEIVQVANSCRAQVVCWSPAAVKSVWVCGEAEVGRKRGTLIQTMIETCTLDPPFNMLHAENISDWTGEPQHRGVQKILGAIGRKLERPGLAELALIQGSPIAEDWKKWAAKYPADPCAEEAWAKAEALHLDAERSRLAQEWQAARKKAEDDEARRRAAEEARRRAAPPTPRPTPQPTRSVDTPPPRRQTAVIAAVAVAALGLAGASAYFAPRLLGGADAEHLPPGVSEMAANLAGRWRLESTGNCATPASTYEVRVTGDVLALLGPDGSGQPETIQGEIEQWLHTQDANGVSAYYQTRGGLLAYRYGDVDDQAGETRFVRCDLRSAPAGEAMTAPATIP